MHNKIIAFLIYGLFLIEPASAERLIIPKMQFQEAFTTASDVVLAKMVSVRSVDAKIDLFGEKSSGKIREAILRIKKSWKGKPDKEISVLFWGVQQGNSEDVNAEKFMSGDLRPTSQEVLFFIHDIEGKKVISPFWGIYVFRESGSKMAGGAAKRFGPPEYSQSKFINALDKISTGKTVESVVKEFNLDRDGVF